MSDRPNARDVWDNWRNYEGSVFEKLRVAARNNAIKLRTRKDCCGNHGEPGC